MFPAASPGQLMMKLQVVLASALPTLPGSIAAAPRIARPDRAPNRHRDMPGRVPVFDAAPSGLVEGLGFDAWGERARRGEAQAPIFCLRTCSSNTPTARARIFPTSPSGIE